MVFPARVLGYAAGLVLCCALLQGQVPGGFAGPVEGNEGVDLQTKQIFERGLAFLAETQKSDGTWTGKLVVGGYGKSADPQGAGATNGETALCLMCFLASGEDPNFGRYSRNIRKAVRALLLTQNLKSGYIGKNMYEHGFAMLALSEAYGVVDESRISFPEGTPKKPTIARALELAVGCAMAGQKNNPYKAWTYGPENQRNNEGTRADTSVSGAVLMGLLGVRNAGIKIPDKVIDDALDYFRTMTVDGQTGYAQSMQWATPETRSAISALVMTIGKRTHWEEFQKIPRFITQDLRYVDQQHPFYSRYYTAQALFQVDMDAWRKWHLNQRELVSEMQNENGSIIPKTKIGFTSTYQTPTYTTAFSLLALALEYRTLPIYERQSTHSTAKGN